MLAMEFTCFPWTGYPMCLSHSILSDEVGFGEEAGTSLVQSARKVMFPYGIWQFTHFKQCSVLAIYFQ